jgi:hypothetical protein
VVWSKAAQLGFGAGKVLRGLGRLAGASQLGFGFVIGGGAQGRAQARQGAGGLVGIDSRGRGGGNGRPQRLLARGLLCRFTACRQQALRQSRRGVGGGEVAQFGRVPGDQRARISGKARCGVADFADALVQHAGVCRRGA